MTDSLGNDLSGSDSSSPEYSKLNVTREIESDIKKKVSAVLLGPYQMNQFKVSVTATVDTDQLITEQTLYTPSPDGDNTGVISEETRSTDSSSNTQSDGGVAGTSTNSEVPTYPVGGTSGESTSSASDENIKYQVSQTKSQAQKSGAKIEKLSIGIAINKASFEPGERESITQLVAYAAGVSPESITVQNFQFYEEETPATPEPEAGLNKIILFGGIGAGVLLFAAIVAFALMARKRKASEAAVAEALEIGEMEGSEETLNSLFGETGRAATGEKFKPIEPVMDMKREEIKEFAKSNPEIAAQMIKSWLRSEE